MKMSLLEIVQDILNSMDSDEVNSISDTIESQQVAQIVKSCYREMIGNRDWPHLQKLIQLESLIDVEKPNYLRIPSNLKELVFFKYDCHKPDQDKVVQNVIKYKYPDEFLRYISSRNSENDNVLQVTDFSGSTLLIYNNYAPQYWTSFDDKHLITDSYDADVDDTLQTSKTQVLAYMEPTWVHTDSAIPDLPSEAFAALVEEAKSTAFVELKQTANQKAEQKASRQQRWLSRKAWAVKGGIRYDDYGRKNRR